MSRDFKSTLEKEVGLDDISSSSINTYNSKITGGLSATPSTTSTGDSETTTDPSEWLKCFMLVLGFKEDLVTMTVLSSYKSSRSLLDIRKSHTPPF